MQHSERRADQAPEVDDVATSLAGVLLDHDNEPFFRGLLRRKLLINRCRECGHRFHPPRPICPACWSFAVAHCESPGRGSIYMVTVLRQGPPAEGVDYRDGYPVATVELDEQPGLRLVGTVVGVPASAVRIGQRVEIAWIERHAVPWPAFSVVGAGGGA